MAGQMLADRLFGGSQLQMNYDLVRCGDVFSCFIIMYQGQFKIYEVLFCKLKQEAHDPHCLPQ
jgi:hypothetical protein